MESSSAIRKAWLRNSTPSTQCRPACSSTPPSSSGRRTVEDTNVVQPEKAAGEDLLAVQMSMRFTHQVKLNRSF